MHPPSPPQDLYIGGRLEVFNRAFELTGADEYSLTYMENNCHIFVMADAAAILESLRGQVGAASKESKETGWGVGGGRLMREGQRMSALPIGGPSPR
jgi:hypothetical protein